MIMYSVNPQKRGLAVARWENGQLMRAWYWENYETERGRELYALGNHLLGASRLVIEQMRVYPGPQQKGDQNDLIEVAATVGAVCAGAYWDQIRIVYPREWKGTTPKKIFAERIKSRLSEAELADVQVLKNKKQELDLWDAVGIGLFDLGRLRPKRFTGKGIGQT